VNLHLMHAINNKLVHIHHPQDLASSSSNPTNKSIEPADYTFELISVGDEWARSLIY
ncbi:hypothetical protein CU098_010953, partial [Rhizopus stolonifer]